MSIAILGYGIVGSGAFDYLGANKDRLRQRTGAEVNVKWILDLKDKIDVGAQKFLTHNASDILDDPEVTIVVECMGGIEPAYTYVKTALTNGKSVVTSNKELVAARGGELLAIAKANSVNFLFEASVGGGIPIILPLEQSLMLDDITQIAGILNGTTNYILTNMKNRGISFDEALKEAQDAGFAEANPSADVDGFDTCRKLAILLSLTLGKQVDFNDIPITGITKITQEDFALAASKGKTIKLLGMAKIDGGRLSARVAPFMIDLTHPLANIYNEYNAISVTGKLSGDMMFCGKGAGKLPTAAAVITDVAMCARHPDKYIGWGWNLEKVSVSPLETENIGGMFVC
ncbi:MAG: homoserine dehydrogenase [Defluviitaleaceae bacterium]|nr:homoserine dehydrogenase [Defluviitaleaceae bacterium]